MKPSQTFPPVTEAGAQRCATCRHWQPDTYRCAHHSQPKSAAMFGWHGTQCRQWEAACSP